jgi:uncharacterized protein YjaZ
MGIRGEEMGIIRTDEWLEEEFENPMEICKKLQPYFKGQSPRRIYSQLVQFGMYQPTRAARHNLKKMKEQKVWDHVNELFINYSGKWSGPNIPIFLFPLSHSGGIFIREERKKGGVSFPDKMFLFLSSYEHPKEIEALFVHEYHHVCRLNKEKRRIEEFTLLDSLVIEGLAEYTVLKTCGPKFTAPWCEMYSEKEVLYYWNKFLKKHLNKKKNEREHDELLFGGRRVPKLLGYAVGYNIISKYYENHNYSTKLSFEIPSEEFIDLKNM